MPVFDDSIFRVAPFWSPVMEQSQSEASIRIIRIDERLMVEWNGGALESSPEADGPYQAVDNAASPYTVEDALNQQFFRIRAEAP